jgi:acyl-coenzyme A thioesterase 9
MNCPDHLPYSYMTTEDDFIPGLKYFFNEEIYSVKLFNRADNINTPENGFVQVKIPFDRSIKLENDFRLLQTNRLRYGKLLEILDYISGFSAYRYNKIKPQSKDSTFVTASVDNIEMYKTITIEKPLIINSYPTYVGSSSMEIRMDLFDSEIQIEENFLGSAFFMYVIRDGKNYSLKKLIPQINNEMIENLLEREKAKLRYEIGNENKEKRITFAKNSLNKIAPNTEESQLLHNIFLVKNTINTKNKIKIKETQIEKSLLMHSQNMNINGHIFGGYIMKQALDAAYVCAYMHCNKETPIIFAIDNVTFYKPVIIGSVAKFVANVCYIHEELMHVSVEVFNYVDDIDSDFYNPSLTTVVNVTYLMQKKFENIVPSSYECGIKYLGAKRRMEKLFDFI